MASHRAAPGGLGSGTSGAHSTVAGKRRAAGAAIDTTSPAPYVGKRVARPRDYESPITPTDELVQPPVPRSSEPVAPSVPDESAPLLEPTPVLLEPVLEIAEPTPVLAEPVLEIAEPTPVLLEPVPVVDSAPVVDEAPALDVSALLALGDAPTRTAAPASAASGRRAATTTRRRGATAEASPGRRAAARHTGRRGRLFKVLPPGPILAGVATMSVAVLGALTSGVSSDLTSSVVSADSARILQASALSGTTGQSNTNLLARGPAVSRDGQRDATGDAATTPLEKETEAQAEQRDAAVASLANQAEKQAHKIELNLWQLPVVGYHITNTFGVARSYYSSGYHTGLDFAAPYGTEIHSIASGVVSSASYDGAYGNKTVVTLDDGTEIWYCHQSAFAVSVGDTVTPGELIGYIGETGNAYGAHLHVEVHPGGGDAVDPYAAFVAHGVTP